MTRRELLHSAILASFDARPDGEPMPAVPSVFPWTGGGGTPGLAGPPNRHRLQTRVNLTVRDQPTREVIVRLCAAAGMPLGPVADEAVAGRVTVRLADVPLGEALLRAGRAAVPPFGPVYDERAGHVYIAVMRRTGTVVGRVLGSDGAPAAGARLVARAPDRSAEAGSPYKDLSAWSDAVTDADGRYELCFLIQDHYDIFVSRPGGKAVAARSRFTGPRREERLRLPDLMLGVSGTIKP